MKREFFTKWSGQSLPAVMSIVGPTGTGKSSLAQALSDKHYNKSGQRPLMVSADSVALYRGLDIGSAKPDLDSIQKYGWIGIDLFRPDEVCTARAFIDKVEAPITEALKNKTPILIVGGSMFYERALVE